MGHLIRRVVSIESLDPRRLLAATYQIADYFTYGRSESWKYHIAEYGVSGSVTRVSTIETNGVANFRTQIYTDGHKRHFDNNYIVSRKQGVQRTLQQFVEGPQLLNVAAKSPATILPPTLAVGEAYQWSSPVNSNFDSPSYFGHGEGTASGSAVIEAVETITLPNNLVFTNALRLRTEETQKINLSNFNNQSEKRQNSDVTISWYVRDIGLVKQLVTESTKVTDKLGAIHTNSNKQTLYLKTSSMIHVISTLTDGILAVQGTTKADHISLRKEGDKIWAMGNDAGKIYDSANVSLCTVNAGGGNDTITSSDGVGPEYLYGNTGDDLIMAGDGNDTLSGGAGKNKLSGGAGDDRINGSGSNDSLYGQSGADRLYGSGGDDLLDGGGGIDRLFGGDGNDSLVGGFSNDKLYGEEGKDTLVGNEGADILDGGARIDSAISDPTDLLVSI